MKTNGIQQFSGLCHAGYGTDCVCTLPLFFQLAVEGLPSLLTENCKPLAQPCQEGLQMCTNHVQLPGYGELHFKSLLKLYYTLISNKSNNLCIKLEMCHRLFEGFDDLSIVFVQLPSKTSLHNTLEILKHIYYGECLQRDSTSEMSELLK